MPRTTIEKIENIQSQIEQLENERKRLMQQQREQERKAQTKRLIERGAILESLVPGAAEYTNEQIKAFLEKTVGSDSARKILAGMAPQGGTVDASVPVAAAPKGGASATGKSASTEQGAG
jgi:TolA-binding protein